MEGVTISWKLDAEASGEETVLGEGVRYEDNFTAGQGRLPVSTFLRTMSPNLTCSTTPPAIIASYSQSGIHGAYPIWIIS